MKTTTDILDVFTAEAREVVDEYDMALRDSVVDGLRIVAE